MEQDVSNDDGVLISDGSQNNGASSFLGLPLAGVLCIVITVYGLFVIVCLFVRQVLLDRKPLNNLEALNCCECLLLLPRPPPRVCHLPCSQPTKTNEQPWRERLERLWARLPTVGWRLPQLPACARRRLHCPSSVLCCGLEIRRHGPPPPAMVDASVSGADLEPRAPPPAAGDSELTDRPWLPAHGEGSESTPPWLQTQANTPSGDQPAQKPPTPPGDPHITSTC